MIKRKLLERCLLVVLFVVVFSKMMMMFTPSQATLLVTFDRGKDGMNEGINERFGTVENIGDSPLKLRIIIENPYEWLEMSWNREGYVIQPNEDIVYSVFFELRDVPFNSDVFPQFWIDGRSVN